MSRLFTHSPFLFFSFVWRGRISDAQSLRTCMRCRVTHHARMCLAIVCIACGRSTHTQTNSANALRAISLPKSFGCKRPSAHTDGGPRFVMADAIAQHLDAVRGFLGQLGDSRAVAKVAGAQKVHLEQLLTTATLSIVDAMKVTFSFSENSFFDAAEAQARIPEPWTLTPDPPKSPKL